MCGDASYLYTAHLPKGEALPASVGQSSANLGKSILSQSVDIGNDLFTQTELPSSEETWRIALERHNAALSTAELSSGLTQYLAEKHTLVSASKICGNEMAEVYEDDSLITLAYAEVMTVLYSSMVVFCPVGPISCSLECIILEPGRNELNPYGSFFPSGPVPMGFFKEDP